MNTVLFVNATIGFSENLFLVLLYFQNGNTKLSYNNQTVQKCRLKLNVFEN